MSKHAPTQVSARRDKTKGHPSATTGGAALAFCVDVGSTFTKAALIDLAGAQVLGTAETPTTIETDVLDGLTAVRSELAVPADARTLVCSSAGGGLRLAVVGYERTVTAEAGHRVGLSAGAKVVHVAGGELSHKDVADLQAAQPDIVLLVGGTDGGNSEVLLHNAGRLATARLGTPVVLAGNAEAAASAAASLRAGGIDVTVTDNVLPRIGIIHPEPARGAIREVFLRHVIGGKGLSSGDTFATMVRAATPDAVLTGVEVLAGVLAQDVLVVDIGGATTDVYSCLEPTGEDAGLRRDVVATLWHARTVEADLGMRWNAVGIVAAARREALPVDEALAVWATTVAADPAYLPADAHEATLDRDLAVVAATVAVRRHARPSMPGAAPRPLGDVAYVVGSGGVLRHSGPQVAEAVLDAVARDHAGGWRTPREARALVDRHYLLFAVGLLAGAGHDGAAAALARRIGT